MKQKYIFILFLAFVFYNKCSLYANDTLVLVRFYAYNDIKSQALENVIIFIQKEDSGKYSNYDTLYTGQDGKVEAKLPKGSYNFWPYLQTYSSKTSYNQQNIMKDTTSLDFHFIKPEISLNEDTFFMEPEKLTDTTSLKLVLSNKGTGKLQYNSVLYLYEKLPGDIELYLQNNQKKSTSLSENNKWTLLFRGEKDQIKGNHDIKEVYSMVDEVLFKTKVIFHDTIRSFNRFNFNLLINYDRNETTGYGEDGLDAVIVVSTYDGNVYSNLYEYYSGQWNYSYSPVVADLDSTKDYIEIEYPALAFNSYDIMLAYAIVNPGDNAYYDRVPEWHVGNPMLIPAKPTEVILNKAYGEIATGKKDTIEMAIDPAFQNSGIDTFYLAVLCNDRAHPLSLIPVIFRQKPNNIEELKDVVLNCYPNPMNSSTKISYFAPKQEKIKVSVINLQGQTIKVLFNDMCKAGLQEYIWDGKNINGSRVKPGTYLYNLESATMLIKGKITVTK